MIQITPTVRTLLIINVVLSFLQSQFPALTVLGGLYPIGSVYFQPWQFLTYMFLHGGLMHLISNMLGLVFIGSQLENQWGGRRFLTFWLVCGIGAGVLYEGVRQYEVYQMHQDQLAFHAEPSAIGFMDFYREYFPAYEGAASSIGRALKNDPANPDIIRTARTAIDAAVEGTLNDSNAAMVGASGALFGVLFAFGFLFPQETLFIFPFPFPIKAWLFVFLYTAYELWQGIHPVPGDNVAHFAHLGGMLIGFVVLKIWQRNGTHYG